MSANHNKEVVLRFFEVVCNGHRIDLIQEIFAADVEFDGKQRSPDDVKDYLKEITDCFDHPRVQVNKMVVEGDWVSTMRTWTGIQRTDYKGYAATNKLMAWREISVVRLENGKIKEDWVLRGQLTSYSELSPGPRP